MKLTPTPITAAIAGLFAGIVMPLIWPKLGDETLNWVFAFLLVIALPMHVLVVGFNPPREAGQGGRTARSSSAWRSGLPPPWQPWR
ncbi:hypothetical protein [Pseudoxanthomonas mexicana]